MLPRKVAKHSFSRKCAKYENKPSRHKMKIKKRSEDLSEMIMANTSSFKFHIKILLIFFYVSIKRLTNVNNLP